MEYALHSDGALDPRNVLRESVAPALLEGLTQTQLDILEKVARIHSEPIVPLKVPQRSPDKVSPKVAAHRANTRTYARPYATQNASRSLPRMRTRSDAKAVDGPAATAVHAMAQVAASKAMHKRINPGFVEMPYQSTNSMEYKYIPAPDFSTAYLKSKSDCDFQGFAAEAILKHVDLNKTSH